MSIVIPDLADVGDWYPVGLLVLALAAIGIAFLLQFGR